MSAPFRSMLVVALFALLISAAPAAAYEVHVSIRGSGVVDETTDANLAYCSSPQTTKTGDIGAHCYPGDPDGPYGGGWTVRYVATPSDGWRFVRWQSDGSANPVICDGATNGSSTYTGTACQFATWNNLQTQAVFEDVTAPTPNITGGPAASSTTGRSATFTFGVSNNPAGQPTTYLCRLTGPSGLVQDWTSCATSGKAYSDLADGGHTFDVKATDPSGNNSTASRSWTVDAIAPETLLTDGPAAFTFTNDPTATFQFTGSGDPAKFLCRVDTGAVVNPCSSPYTTPDLADGQHTFEVWAEDARGNVETSPASRTWNVDTVAPESTLEGGPAEGSSTTATSATFSLGAADAASFRCSLDGGAPGPCFSPHTVTVGVGPHELEMWATDAAGNIDVTPATRSWTVTAPPKEEPAGGGGGTDNGGGTSTPDTSTPVVVPPVADPVIPNPVVALAAPRVSVRVGWGHNAKRRHTILSKLTLTEVTPGSQIVVTCRGKKCPVKRFAKSGGGTIKLTKFIRRKLAVGMVLSISVSKPGHVGRVIALKIRAGKGPQVKETCLYPGESSARAC